VDIYNGTNSKWTNSSLTVKREGRKRVANVALFVAVNSPTKRASYSAVVDVYDSTTGMWSTAALLVGCANLAATSLGQHSMALFAGGQTKFKSVFNVVEIYYTKSPWPSPVVPPLYSIELVQNVSLQPK